MSKRKKLVWTKTEEFTPVGRDLLARFESAFGCNNTSYTVSWVYEDRISVQRYGYCDPYLVCAFIRNNPDVYVEVHPVSRDYWEFRMFSNDYYREKELPRMKRRMEAAIECGAPPTSVRLRVER